MKHRSVIAFVIVAAALFSLPQLSHDLQALKGAVGARLHRELLHAFLNLPTGEPAAAPVVERPSEMLASCTINRSGTEGVRGRRGEGRAAGRTFVQRAMIGDPINDPVVNGAKTSIAKADIEEAAERVITMLPAVNIATEVAMITPPESGPGPRALSNALVLTDAARVDLNQARVEADGLRVAYTTAAGIDVKDAEWQKSTGEVLRRLNRTLNGTYELHLLRDGSKAKVLKIKCTECPKTPPRAPRALPAVVPHLSPSAPFEWASE